MLLTATLLGLIAALGILDGRLLGVSMIDRPLVMCALTGLVCGNLHEGILIGATLELIFLGNVAIGAAHPPDIVTELRIGHRVFDHVRSWSRGCAHHRHPCLNAGADAGNPGARGERPLWSSGGPLCGTG